MRRLHICAALPGMAHAILRLSSILSRDPLNQLLTLAADNAGLSSMPSSMSGISCH